MKKNMMDVIEMIDASDEKGNCTIEGISMCGHEIVDVKERSMNMDYIYRVVFKEKEEKLNIFYMTELTFPCAIGSFIWHDYVANVGEDFPKEEIEFKKAYWAGTIYGKPYFAYLEDKRADYADYANIGELLNFIREYNLPMDGKILLQRVEDSYFENSWTTVDMKGYHYNQEYQHQQDIIAGKFDNKIKYPNYPESAKKILTDDELAVLKDKYYHAWSPVYYKERPNDLFLDAHY